MFRFSLRSFLVACVAAGVASGVYLQGRWDARATFYDESMQETLKGTRYWVHWAVEDDPLAERRFLHAIIFPYPSPGRRTERLQHQRGHHRPQGKGLEAYQNGVFYRGELVGGYGLSKIVIAIPERETVEVIPLSPEDAKALDAIMGKTLLQSKLWKLKVEPEIDRLAAPRPRPRPSDIPLF